MYEMRSDFMGEVVGFGVVFIGGGGWFGLRFEVKEVVNRGH
jgi:hypothetical protein